MPFFVRRRHAGVPAVPLPATDKTCGREEGATCSGDRRRVELPGLSAALAHPRLWAFACRFLSGPLVLGEYSFQRGALSPSFLPFNCAFAPVAVPPGLNLAASLPLPEAYICFQSMCEDKAERGQSTVLGTAVILIQLPL